MKKFFTDFAYSIKQFFEGRYGTDLLSWVLIIVGLVVSVISGRLGSDALRILLSIMSFAMVIFAFYRSYSRNIEARRKELQAFKSIFSAPINFVKVEKMKKNDPEHLYIKCPNCKTTLRVPKGKGRIILTCPKCQNKIEIKS